MDAALVTKLVSTNQLVALHAPPATKPRARRRLPTDTDTLVHCQPPELRVPAPRLSQSVPLAETSRVVRQTSGLVPPRSQVSVASLQDRLWVAGSVLFSRPMSLRDCPASIPNQPPTRIFPSACTAREDAPHSVPGLKWVSSVPSALSRPMWLRSC